MASSAKTTTKLGYREYVCFPNDGKRHEIIDGDHYVNPAPETYHQTLSRRIQFQLYSQIELNGLGFVYNAPTDLHLSDHDVVQPDLILVLSERQTIITPTKIKGCPHLVVEILSASSIQNDRVLKKELYQKSGIPEYWIVDPAEHVVEQLALREASYQPVDHDEHSITLQVLPSVNVDLTKVW